MFLCIQQNIARLIYAELGFSRGDYNNRNPRTIFTVVNLNGRTRSILGLYNAVKCLADGGVGVRSAQALGIFHTPEHFIINGRTITTEAMELAYHAALEKHAVLQKLAANQIR